MNRLSDRGSIPLRSIPEKPLKSSVLAVFLYIFDGKNFDYPEKPLKYKHIRRISD